MPENVRGQRVRCGECGYALLVPGARMIFGLTSWSMVEVFVIGVIVSLVKLASMATIGRT